MAVSALKTFASRAFPEQWLFILGTLFVVVTLLLPEGLAGLPALWRRLQERLRPAAPEGTPPPPPEPLAAAGKERE